MADPDLSLLPGLQLCSNTTSPTDKPREFSFYVSFQKLVNQRIRRRIGDQKNGNYQCKIIRRVWNKHDSKD